MAVLACSVDGILQDPTAVDSLARATQYGDGLFETIAVIALRPLFWVEHLRRLRQGATALGIALPDDHSLTSLWQDLLVSLPATNPNQRLVLKILCVRSDGQGYATPQRSAATLLFLLQEWPLRPKRYWQEGVCAGLSAVPLQCGAEYLAVKTLNRLNQIMAWRALPEEWQEAVLCDQAGNLREGIQSNLCWRIGDRLLTPDLQDGGIAGIQLGAILQQARSWGLTVEVVREPAEALERAEEILFCNSLICSWPVRRWQERDLPGAQGSLAQRLTGWGQQLGLFPEIA